MKKHTVQVDVLLYGICMGPYRQQPDGQTRKKHQNIYKKMKKVLAFWR